MLRDEVKEDFIAQVVKDNPNLDLTNAARNLVLSLFLDESGQHLEVGSEITLQIQGKHKELTLGEYEIKINRVDV